MRTGANFIFFERVFFFNCSPNQSHTELQPSRSHTELQPSRSHTELQPSQLHTGESKPAPPVHIVPYSPCTT
jgi:hypothetical protein